MFICNNEHNCTTTTTTSTMTTSMPHLIEEGKQAEVEIVTHVRGGMGLFVGRRVLECTGVEERHVERVFVC